MLDEENSSVVEQEVAAPVEAETETETVETQDVGEGENPANAEQGQEEVKVPDKLIGQIRKREEAKAAKRYEREMQELDQLFVDLCGDAVNPLTGKPVTGAKDYAAAVRENERRRMIAEATNGDAKVADTIERLLKNDPEKAEMRKELDAIKQERIQREAADNFQKELAELNKAYPDVTQEDLVNSPESSQLIAMVGSGVSLINAYRALHMDSIVQQGSVAAKQAAINEVRSKGHLAPAGAGTAPADDGLTDSEYEAYEAMGFTRAEAAKYHKEFAKEKH